MLFSNKKVFIYSPAFLALVSAIFLFYGINSAEASSPASNIYEDGAYSNIITASRTLTPQKLPSKLVAGSAGIKTASPSESYVVSVKSVKISTEAEKLVDRLKASGYNAYSSSVLVKEARWYRVRVGFFKNRSVAKQALREIRKAYSKDADSAWVARAKSNEIAKHWRGSYDLPLSSARAGKKPVAPAIVTTQLCQESASPATAQGTRPSRGVNSVKNIAGARPTVSAKVAANVATANVKAVTPESLKAASPRLKNRRLNNKAPVKSVAPPKKSQPGTANDMITINFIDVNITTLVKFISDTTGKNFIHDDRLRGQVTIVAPAPIKRDEAFDLFTSLLALKGFAMVRSGEAYKIVPSSMVKQSSIKVLGAQASRFVLTRIISHA